MTDLLNIDVDLPQEESITKIEYHTYTPFHTAFGNSDEIRIVIQNQDLVVLLSESYLYIEGKLLKKDGSSSASAKLVNNCTAFLFEEIRYELNGVEIDRTRDVGTASTLKNYISLNQSESNMLLNAGWSIKNEASLDKEGNFNFCIPLSMLLGFMKDYKKAIINSKHELILIRTRTDRNAVVSPTDDVSFHINKLQWRVPHLRISDETKLPILKLVENGHMIPLNFRSWDIYVQPLVPTTNQNTWSVKTSTELERPRYVIFALQTNRQDQKDKDASVFDSCNLTDFKIFLNSESFAYDSLNIHFEHNKFALAYHMYANFQQSFYNRTNQPLLSRDQFKTLAPIIVVDCSRQNESIKVGPVDVRVQYKSAVNLPASTTAFCLLLHERYCQYCPLTNEVKKF